MSPEEECRLPDLGRCPVLDIVASGWVICVAVRFESGLACRGGSGRKMKAIAERATAHLTSSCRAKTSTIR